jgi:hypothetical protein
MIECEPQAHMKIPGGSHQKIKHFYIICKVNS